MRNALLTLALLAATGCSLVIDPDGVEPTINKTVESLAVTPATATVAKGATQQLTATATYTDGSTGDVTAQAAWTSGAPGVATVANTVGSKGLVTAAAASGSAVITASLGGKSATATITASPATVVSIAVEGASAPVVRGLTQQLTATATWTDGTTTGVTASATWTSGAPSVATVSDAAGTKGLVTAVAAGGPVTITAAYGGQSGTAAVTVVLPSVTSLSVTPASATLPVDGTVQLVATASLDDGTTPVVTAGATWATGNALVATVSPTGLVTGVAAGGPITITATYGGRSGTASVTVTAATVTSIAVTPATATVAKGATQPLTATATYSDLSTADVTGQATWSSGTPAVATVSNAAGTKGIVTAVGTAGTATITATFGGQGGTAVVTAAPAEVVSIAVTPATATVAKGATQQLTATATWTDATTTNVTASATWTTSAAAVASVSASGLVTAVGTSGTTTVTAAFGSRSGTAVVTAAPAAVVSIAVTPATATVAKGATRQLTATATLTDATTTDVTASATWTSGTPAVATVSDAAGTKGLVTAVGTSGTTTITAASGGKTGTAVVTAAPAAVASIAVTPATLALAVGEVYNALVATATYTDATTGDVTASATWTTSAAGVATVSNTAGSKGRVTAVSASATPATITATFGGASGTAAVTVNAAEVVSIAVTPATPVIGIGGTVQLIATATYTDSSSLEVTGQAVWTTGNGSIATVSDAAGTKGLVTGVAGGTANVTASFGGQVGNTAVTVRSIASIAVTPSTATVPKGRTQQYVATATLTPSGTQDVTEDVTWSSSDALVATVSNAAGTRGLATANAAGGSATLTAALSGRSGTATLTAAPAVVVSVAVTPATTTLAKGSTQQLTATATYSDATTVDVTGSATWTSSLPGVATVSSTTPTKGLVTAVGTSGTTTITASYSGQSGTAAVTAAPAAVVSIAVTPATATVPQGATQQLTATATWTDATTTTVTGSASWTSTAATVASVSDTAGSKGLVTAVANSGSATITATYGGRSGTAVVTAGAPALSSIAVAPATVSIPLGGHRQLTATGTYTNGSTQDLTSQATWTSSVTTAATVGNLASNKGAVTTVATGSTTVTAAFGGKSGASAVTVTPAALVSIRIDLRSTGGGGGPDAPYISPSMPLQPTPVAATATGVYSTGATIDVTQLAAWSSSAPLVVGVSSSYPTRGQLTTLSAGAATVTATYGGVTGTLAVTVHAPIIIWVAPFPSELPVPVGAPVVGLTAKALLDDWSIIDITTTATWSSSNPGVVTVQSGAPDGGKLTGVAPGSAMVTASQGGTSGASAVFVKSASVTLQSLTVFPNPLTVAYGEDRSLSALAQYSDGSAYDVTEVTAWSSSDTGVAVVDFEGRVYPQVPSGTATITGTFGGLAPVTVPVTVIPGWWFNIESSPPIPTGQKLRMRAVQNSGAAGGEQLDLTDYLTWTSWDPTLADFLAGDPPGVITAVAPVDGSTTIQGQLPGGSQGTGWVQVTSAPLSSIAFAITPATLSAPVGGTAALSAALSYPTMGTYYANGFATWTTSNAAVVQVDGRGNITTVGGGTATVTATIFGLSASCTVTVVSTPIQSIAITPASLSVAPGVSGQLTATAALQGGGTLDVTRFVAWRVPIPTGVSMSVASVGPDGTVWGYAEGTAQVVALYGTLNAYATVTVSAPVVQALWLNASSWAAYSGTTIKLTAWADFGPTGGREVTEEATWTVDNAAASISNLPGTKGVLTGSSVAGQVNVTVSATFGGQTGTYIVSIFPGTLSGVRLTVTPPFDMKIGQQTWLSLWGDITGCLGGPCYVDLTGSATWSSTNPAVADVSNQSGSRGMVTAYRRDIATSTTISAAYPGFPAASILLNVWNPALQTLFIRNLDPWYEPQWGGDPCMSSWSWNTNLNSVFDVRYVACAQYDNGRTVDVTGAAVWSTSAPAIATVSNSPKGLLSTHAAGLVTVTATFAGTNATQDVTVNSNTLTRVISDGGIVLAHVGALGGDWAPNAIRARAVYANDTQDYEVTRFLTATPRDPAIASVGAYAVNQGLPVLGLAAGSTLVDAYYRGYSFSAPVTVDARPYQAAQIFVQSDAFGAGLPWFLTTAPGLRKVPAGMPVRLELGAFDAIGLPWTATESGAWSSTHPAVATVSTAAGSRGDVTTLSPGYATIEATVDGQTGTFDVEVTSATLTSIRLDRINDVAPTNAVVRRFYLYATYSDGSTYDVSDYATWPNGPYATWTGKPGEYVITGAGTSSVNVSFGGASTPLLLVGF